MKKLLSVRHLALLLALAFLACMARPALAGDVPSEYKATPQELKKMDIFLSNFTEIGMTRFDVEKEGAEDSDRLHLGSPAGVPDLIHFGIRHNYINNFKSRIATCSDKGCKHGSLVIDGKYVQESVKKYFDIPLKNQSSVDSDPPYYYDGKRYHFEGADGEATYYAKITKIGKFDLKGSPFVVNGYLYNAEDKNDRPATFKASFFQKNGRYVITSFYATYK